MGTAVVCGAILLLLTLHQGAALKCNFCYSKQSGLCTTTSTQTCSALSNACAAVLLPAPLNYSFRSCMNRVVCQGFVKTPGVIARCCTTDLCN